MVMQFAEGEHGSGSGGFVRKSKGGGRKRILPHVPGGYRGNAGAANGFAAAAAAGQAFPWAPLPGPNGSLWWPPEAGAPFPGCWDGGGCGGGGALWGHGGQYGGSRGPGGPGLGRSPGTRHMAAAAAAAASALAAAQAEEVWGQQWAGLGPPLLPGLGPNGFPDFMDLGRLGMGMPLADPLWPNGEIPPKRGTLEASLHGLGVPPEFEATLGPGTAHTGPIDARLAARKAAATTEKLLEALAPATRRKNADASPTEVASRVRPMWPVAEQAARQAANAAAGAGGGATGSSSAAWTGKPARGDDAMCGECFLGEWIDSDGSNVSVTEGEGGSTTKLSATVSRSKGADLQLTLRTVSFGGGWQCGHSVLDAEWSSPGQLYWVTADGKLTVWVKRQDVGEGGFSACSSELSEEDFIERDDDKSDEDKPPPPKASGKRVDESSADEPGSASSTACPER
eukprot:TRINITY_DN28570_c0_g1_i1.p1 TRINITY_DN28570_c0_g1~~TRINITY_DN28570_c0_g1_i1.p1  ORF type:complete len:454 (+),score=89.89 TRINITY_DN28570_c0_g1_i1:215-1576(+)